MNNWLRSWGPAAFVVLLASCGSSPVGPSSCTPGQAVACAGPGACMGSQICAADGRSFGACVCSTDGGVDATDGPLADREGGLDAPPASSGNDGPMVQPDVPPPTPDAPPALVLDGGLSDAPSNPPDVVGGILPSTHDFGGVAVGAMSEPFTFTIGNAGGAALTGFSVALNGADFSAPIAGNQCAGLSSLPAGRSCTIAVVFKPASRGLKSGSLVASGGGQTVTASLTGNGQNESLLVINPTSATLVGAVGKDGPPVIFNVANAGDTATGVVSVALGGADANSFKVVSNTCLAPLPASDSCQVQVSTSAAATIGTKMATLTVSGGGMAVAMLTATITTSDSLTITPNAADFMGVAVGQMSTAIDFTVKNIGGTATAPLSVTPSTNEFVITANTCNAMVVPANGTCGVSVQFRPSSKGSKTALLTVSGTAGQTAIAQLSGTGN